MLDGRCRPDVGSGVLRRLVFAAFFLALWSPPCLSDQGGYMSQGLMRFERTLLPHVNIVQRGFSPIPAYRLPTDVTVGSLPF